MTPPARAGIGVESTTEVRWWWRGSSPSEVAAWFTGLRGAVRHEDRTDHYLVSASDPDTGIKARAGEQLDIKSLAGRAVGVAIVGGVVGTVEQWDKWSFALAPEGPTAADLDRDPWIRTSKRRWLVDARDAELELAEVTIGDLSWWTLAVEAEGTGTVGRERLVATVRWLTAAGPPDGLELADERSHGYAELLVGLHRDV